jgi:hypothetical protein
VDTPTTYELDLGATDVRELPDAATTSLEPTVRRVFEGMGVMGLVELGADAPTRSDEQAGGTLRAARHAHVQATIELGQQ